MITNFRQGLITSPVNFLVGGGGFAHINIDIVSVLACASSGSSDYLIEESASVSNAWGPITTSATHYLYWDINRVTGQVTRGMTLYSTIVSATEPAAPQATQMWWNASQNKMFEWNGSRWVEVIRVLAGELTGAVAISYDVQSQVGLNTLGYPGKIVFDVAGKPLRKQDGNFLTSETEMTIPQSGSLVKLDGAFITVKANENLPKNSLVYFVAGASNRVGLASGVHPHIETKTPIGFVQHATYQNEPVNLVTAGKLVQDELWNWDSSLIGKSVYCDANGALTTTRNSEKALRVGTIFSNKSVMLSFDWETQPTTVVGATVTVNGASPIFITGNQDAPVVNVKYVSNTEDGVLDAGQYTVIMDGIAQLPNKSNVGHSHPISDVTGLQVELNGKAPIAHTHLSADVTDLQPKLDAKADVEHLHTIGNVTGLSSALASKSNINHIHGVADITGLQAALDNKSALDHTHQIAHVDGLQVALDGKALINHTHQIAHVDGLQVALDGKAAVSHGHEISDVNGLQIVLDGKAPSLHQHLIEHVDGLQIALDSKAAVSHGHAIADIALLQGVLDGKSNVGHNHAIGEITGLQIVLDNKANINHNHLLGTLVDVANTTPTEGNVLTFNAATNLWEPRVSGGGGTVTVGEKQLAFGADGTGNLISSPNVRYDTTTSSFHLNDNSNSVNANAVISLSTGNSSSGYGASNIYMSASSVPTAGSSISIEAGSVGRASPTIPMGPFSAAAGGILIAAGGGVFPVGIQDGDEISGGNVEIYAGNSVSALGNNTASAGSVYISGGFTNNAVLTGGVEIAGKNVTLSNGTNNITYTSQGALLIDGDAGTTGQVLTSKGAGLPAEWTTISTGGGGGGSTSTSQNGFVMRLTADNAQIRPLGGVTYKMGWTEKRVHTSNPDIFFDGASINVNSSTPKLWKITVQTTIKPYNTATFQNNWTAGVVKYGTEISNEMPSWPTLVNIYQNERTTHVTPIPADAIPFIDELTWTDTYIAKSLSNQSAFMLGTWAQHSAGTPTLRYEVQMIISVVALADANAGAGVEIL